MITTNLLVNTNFLKIVSLFLFVQEDLENGEDVARCPSCSLIVKVIYDEDFFEKKFTEPLRQKARLELN